MKCIFYFIFSAFSLLSIENHELKEQQKNFNTTNETQKIVAKTLSKRFIIEMGQVSYLITHDFQNSNTIGASQVAAGRTSSSGYSKAVTFFKYHLKDIGICFLLSLLFLFAGFFYQQKSRAENIIKVLKKENDNNSFCLEQTTEERDWLMKEIHHRVKNNLQIIISLLNTQSAYLTNEEAIKAVQNSQRRIYALSLIYQRLYQSESLSEVDMVVYIQELITYLKDDFEASNEISFKLNLVSLSLNIDKALPLGLIINEAISNSLKYAFPEKSKGDVLISLISTDQTNYSFSIADNGVGLKSGFQTRPVNSLGKTLMAGLANQIGGIYEMKNNNGVEVTLQFNKKPV